MESVNAALRQMYEDLRPQIEEWLPVGHQLSRQHLIAANEHYFTAQTRFLVVGQHTAGWGQEACELGPWRGQLRIDDLLTIYRKFNNSQLRPDLQARGMRPTCYTLQDGVNCGHNKYGFLWSNLVKVDQLVKVDPTGKDKRGKPAAWIAVRPGELGLVRREIEITSPDVVVFFTGTTEYYCQLLNNTFPGIEYNHVRSVPAGHHVRIEHSMLPQRSYRTHHPSTLDRSGWKARVLSEICRG